MTDQQDRLWRGLAHEVWRHAEPYHAVVYFAPELREVCEGLGLRGGWMTYFASRAAPMGAVSAGVVTATFHGFHPGMVARAIPDAWGFADPAAVVAGRLDAVDRALERTLGSDGLPDAATAELAVGIATGAPDGAGGLADAPGRPLFAANLGLAVPDEPHLALWHAATLLREHRGDGHVAALTAAGVGGCAAQVLQVAAGVVDRETLQTRRGWSDDDWSAAAEELRDRGWLDADGGLTDAGRTARQAIAETTDRLAAAPLRRAGEDAVRRLLHALAPIRDRLYASSTIPRSTPIGLPAPDAPPAA